MLKRLFIIIILFIILFVSFKLINDVSDTKNDRNIVFIFRCYNFNYGLKYDDIFFVDSDGRLFEVDFSETSEAGKYGNIDNLYSKLIEMDSVQGEEFIPVEEMKEICKDLKKTKKNNDMGWRYHHYGTQDGISYECYGVLQKRIGDNQFVHLSSDGSDDGYIIKNEPGIEIAKKLQEYIIKGEYHNVNAKRVAKKMQKRWTDNPDELDDEEYVMIGEYLITFDEVNNEIVDEVERLLKEKYQRDFIVSYELTYENNVVRLYDDALWREAYAPHSLVVYFQAYPVDEPDNIFSFDLIDGGNELMIVDSEYEWQ